MALSTINKGWDCKNCGKDCEKNDKDYYMLKDELWAEIHPQIDGMLCMDCVEEKLGRKLIADDILICPLTVALNPYTRKILADSKPKQLFPVTVSKNDTCFSYVLKRVFGGHLYRTQPSWMYLPLAKFSDILNAGEFSQEQVIVGDILLWEKKAYVKSIPVTIDKFGEIKTQPIDMNRHCVVVESINPIIVSECKLCSEEFNTPHILMKHIVDFKRMPDKILRLK